MNYFKISLPITCQPFNNRIPSIWAGDELCSIVSHELLECHNKELNSYSYLLKAKCKTTKNISMTKFFAVDDAFNPYEPINIDAYVERA